MAATKQPPGAEPGWASTVNVLTGNTKPSAPAPAPKKRQARAPQPAPVRPAAAPQTVAPPKAVAPLPDLEPPHPTLQKYGFNGGINQFNGRVQSVVDSYTHAYGAPPSPGLVFDLARSPVDTHDFLRMFDVPLQPQAARMRAVVNQHIQTGDATLIRPDGLHVKPNPPGLPAADELNHLHDTYPTVQLGVLPVKGGDKVLGAFAAIVDVKGNLQVTDHGMTLAQAQDIQSRASQGFYVPQADIQASEDTLKATNAAATVKQSVTTVKDAQAELNKAMGTTLPVTGFFNQDWLKSLSNWMKTRDYFQRAAKYQAQNAGYQSYASYLKAWKTKQSLIRKHGEFQFFINALNLHAFDSGGDPFNIAKDALLSPFANPQFSPSYPLHALTRSAGLALDVVGGTVLQAKAYMAAGNAFIEAITPKELMLTPGLGGVGVPKGESLDQALARAKAALTANPSWLRVFYPDLPEHETGRLKAIDQLTNFAGDLLLLRKPALTGERVAVGDLAGASRSAYLNTTAGYAYTYLKEGKLGRAAALLEGGTGSERLAAYAAPLIQKGKLSEEQFRDHVAELYTTGRTTLPTGEITGHTLPSLAAKNLVTPRTGTVDIRVHLRDAVDQWDQGLRSGGGRFGTAAADFTSWLRATFSHAAPSQATRGFFDPRLPERIHDFILKTTKDADLANRFESDLVRARATENVAKIAKLNDRLQAVYYKRFPEGDSQPIPNDPFQAQLESESASRFYFPGGNRPDVNGPFGKIAANAQQVSQTLNKIAAFHRLVILSGFPLNLIPVAGKAIAGRSLFFKHMFGDTARRIAGGDTIFGTGLGRWRDEAFQVANTDPAIARRLGAFLDRTTNSETRYLTAGKEKIVASLSTADRFNDPNAMVGAGGYLRRMLDDKALAAYQASTADNVKALTDLILNDNTYRRLWKSARRDAAEKLFGANTVLAKGIDRIHYQSILPAEDFAAQIYNRYRQIEEAAQASGTSLDDAQAVLAASRGAKADQALGKWISGNRVAFDAHNVPVRGPAFLFDDAMSNYISQIMVFNKLNRAGMAKNMLAANYKAFVEAGWEPKVAVDAAMQIAEKQVVYHMLDFANMLQVEQNLRWLSYFATKHRLYWKWVLSTMARTPFAAAVISDARQHLDPQGNLNFTLFGQKLAVPAARLFWVPGREYSEVAPPTQFLIGYLKGGFSVQAGVNAAAGTFGNVFTRDDTSLHLLGFAAAMQAGKMAATYDNAVTGLDPTTASHVNRAINHFQLDYFHDHGRYAPERQAVLHALWTVGAEEMWRANLPLPVVPQSAGNGTQKLLDRFMRLADPAKRSAFLDSHPELAAQFGISKNPGDYQHYRDYWSRYTQALDQFHAAREQIYQQAQTSGMTAQLDLERRTVSTAFTKIFEQLKAEDRAQTPLGRRKEINGETLGLWGQQISADPLVDPSGVIKTMFPNIPAAALGRAVPGELVKQAQAELRLLNDPQWVAKTFPDPSEARTRRRELLQFIDDFRAYPHDALGKVQDDYIAEHVNPYWQHVETQLTFIKTLGRGDKDLAYAKLRAWKDAQDKPVVVDGVRFPSPVAIAWAELPPDIRKTRLAGLATGSWDHLADYEKRLLGLTPAKGMSDAWRDYTASIEQYRQQYPGARVAANQRQYLVKELNKQFPGFTKDWLFAQKPTLERFEATALYREMPAGVKTVFDSEIGSNAKTLIRAYKSGSYNAAELRQTWETYVKTEIPHYLQQHPALARWLRPYLAANPDFLNTLPVK